MVATYTRKNNNNNIKFNDNNNNNKTIYIVLVKHVIIDSVCFTSFYSFSTKKNFCCWPHNHPQNTHSIYVYSDSKIFLRNHCF